MKLVRTAGMFALLLLAAGPAAHAQQAQRSPEETAKSIAARWKPLLGLRRPDTRFEAVALTAEKDGRGEGRRRSDSAKFQQSRWPRSSRSARLQSKRS